MRGAVMYAPGDVRFEDRPDPKIVEPTDAIIRLTATGICGSELWPYRGVEAFDSFAGDLDSHGSSEEGPPSDGSTSWVAACVSDKRRSIFTNPHRLTTPPP